MKLLLSTTLLPEQNGRGPQLADVRHFTVAFPDSTNPVSQLYVTTPPNVALVGIPGDPLSMEGGGPQETAVRRMSLIGSIETLQEMSLVLTCMHIFST